MHYWRSAPPPHSPSHISARAGPRRCHQSRGGSSPFPIFPSLHALPPPLHPLVCRPALNEVLCSIKSALCISLRDHPPARPALLCSQCGPQRSAALRQNQLNVSIPPCSPPPCRAHSAALNEVLRSVKVGFADYWCNVLQVCVGGSLDLHVDLPVDIGAEWQADSFLLKPLALPHTLNLRTCLLTPHTPALSLRPPPQVWPLDREWFLAPYLALDGSCNNTSNVVGRKR